MNSKMSDSTYVAGTCNIGQKEIRRRQFVALVGLFLSLSSLIALISASAPRGARVGIFLPLMVAAVGYVQIAQQILSCIWFRWHF